MIRGALLLAVALPALAWGGVRTRTRDLGAASPVVGLVDFASQVTAADCSGPLTLTAAKGGPVTFARSDSSLCCPLSSAACCWVGANQPCVTSSGVEVFGQASNVLTYSEQFDNGAWAKFGAPPAAPAVSSANAVAAPDGTTTADRVDWPAVASGRSVIYQTFTGTAAAYSGAIWLKGVSGTGTIYLELYKTATGASYGTAACAFTSTEWSRCAVTGTLEATQFALYLGVDLQFDSAHQVAQVAQSIYLWGGSVAQSPVALPYRATTGSAYSGGGSSATTLTMPVSLMNPAAWAVAATGTPMGAWSSSGTLLSLGAYPANNSAGLRADAFSVVDAAGNEAYRLIAPSSGAHQLLLTAAKLGYIDATEYALSAGTGLGYFGTMPTTLYVGARNGSAHFNGTVSRVAQCKRQSGGCR